MSEDPDFEMEVLKNDELDSTDSDSNSEAPLHHEKEKADRSARSSGGGDSDPGIFGLGQVPSDWEVSPLPSLVDIEMGSSPPSATYNEEGKGLPFYQGNADFGYIKPTVSTWCSDPVKTANRNDVLISIRAPVGDLNIADEHCCIGRGLAALRPSGVNGLYLYYGLAQRSRWLARLASGSTFKSVSSADLDKVDLPSPALPEQRKIASVLYAVDQAIQKTEEIIEQTKITKEGVLRRLYGEGIRETEVTHTPAGDTPEHWRISALEDICDIGGGSTPSKKNEAYWGGNVLWASPKDFLGPVMQNTEDKLTEEGVDDCNSKVYEKGSTLIVVRSGILRRKLPIAKAGRPTTVNQDIKAVTPKDGEIDKEYLFQILHSHASRVRRNCMKVGTTVESIETSLLRKFPIKVPPLEEQKYIASIGFDFDQELRIEQEELKRLKRLKSGLMQDLLTGEVRTADKAIEVLEEVQAHE